jgi:hypothetical protein
MWAWAFDAEALRLMHSNHGRQNPSNTTVVDESWWGIVSAWPLC